MPTIANINQLSLEIKNDPDAEYVNDPTGREKLRGLQRALHGLPAKLNPARDAIFYASNDSPLAHLNKGGNVEIYEDSRGNPMPRIIERGKGPINPNSPVIKGSQIKENQQNVQVWYDETKVTAQQVEDIQKLKAHKRVNIPDGKTWEEYKHDLESLGSYVVIRGEMNQYNDAQGNLLKPPRDRILYYSSMPKLVHDSKDCLYFTELDPDGGRILKEDKKIELKQKFKDVLKLQAKVAAANGEAVDVVTPSAFFDELTADEKINAKLLFIDAAKEAAQEISKDPSYNNFKGFLLHPEHETKEQMEKIINENGDLKLAINSGDSAAANYIGQKNHAQFKVADCVMGEALGAAGNGALGERGNKAKEERDTRSMGGEVQLVFGPQFNKHLLNKNKFRAVGKVAAKSSVLAPIVAAAPLAQSAPIVTYPLKDTDQIPTRPRRTEEQKRIAKQKLERIRDNRKPSNLPKMENFILDDKTSITPETYFKYAFDEDMKRQGITDPKTKVMMRMRAQDDLVSLKKNDVYSLYPKADFSKAVNDRAKMENLKLVAALPVVQSMPFASNHKIPLGAVQPKIRPVLPVANAPIPSIPTPKKIEDFQLNNKNSINSVTYFRYAFDEDMKRRGITDRSIKQIMYIQAKNEVKKLNNNVYSYYPKDQYGKAVNDRVKIEGFKGSLNKNFVLGNYQPKILPNNYKVNNGKKVLGRR